MSAQVLGAPERAVGGVSVVRSSVCNSGREQTATLAAGGASRILRVWSRPSLSSCKFVDCILRT